MVQRPQIDPEHLVLTIIAPDQDRLSRVVALMTFCAWMRWPTEQDLIYSAQVATMASIVVGEKARGDIFEPPLTVEILADALINYSLAGPFVLAFEEMEDSITEMIGFFMHCPEELRPSLLKARDFIDKGGFVPEGIEKNEQKQYKRSLSTLKVVWATQAAAGPFLWAAHHSDENLNLLDLLPDDPETIPAATAFLKNKKRILDFFGVARFCQEKLLRLLDPNAAERIRFLSFPDSIAAVRPNIVTFDDAQLEILKSYRAPQ
jgi:hypothetical protein